MRIGVVSDTHGDFQALEQVLDQAGEVDLWLHAGDYSRMLPISRKSPAFRCMRCAATATVMKTGPGGTGDPAAGVHPAMTHGHRYVRYNDWSRLLYWGEEKKADVVIFGHIHVR